MKKAIIMGLVGFLIGLAGSTAYGVKQGKEAAAAAAIVAAAHADSVLAKHVADSVAQHDSTTQAAHGDSTAMAAAPHDSIPAGGTPVAHATATPSEPTPTGSPVAKVDPAAKADAYKQVARVLSAMKAVEAAKVLGFLSDAEVEGILRAVGPRQAADFMTNLPKERAAGLSRRLLVPKPKEQGK